jgi:hypothetical protein
VEIICRKRNITFDYMKSIADKIIENENLIVIVTKPIHRELFHKAFPETIGRIVYRNKRKK